MSRTRSIADEAILDKAIEIISREGADGLTFLSLSTATGLAPATLVQRFHTKQKLLACVAEHCMVDTSAAFSKARSQSESPLEAIFLAFQSLARHIRDSKSFANGLAIFELALLDARLHTQLRDNSADARLQLQQLLDEAIAAGELKPCDTAALAACAQSTFEGATITWSIYQQGEASDWAAQQVEQVIKPYRAKNKE